MAEPPSARTFNRRLKRGLRAAEAQYEPLRRAYQASLRKALKGAQRRLRAMSVEVTAGAKFNPPDEDELFPRGDMARDVTRRTRRPRERAAKSVVRTAAAGIAWDVGGVFSERLVRMAGVRASMMGVMARETVMGIIAEALDQGWTVPETSAAIGKAIEEVTPAQAVMLARTDLVGVQNGASVEAARLVYPDQKLMKTWLATDDERTRETHVEADGQTVPLDQTFSVGDAQLDYPGDPDGPDEEVCNCRCTVIYEPVPAEEGVASAFRLLPPLGMASSRPVMIHVPEAALEEVEIVSAIEAETESEAVGTAWQSVLAVEGEETEDGRYIEPGALSWRDLPLTLMAMTETTEGGHLGAEVAGQIQTIERVGNEIRATGVFDSGEYGQEIARLVREQTLRGVSIDPIVTESEYRLGSADGPVLDDEGLIDAWLSGEKIIWVYLDATVLGATVCPMQAIEGATIEVTASRHPGLGRPFIRPFDPFGQSEITAAAAGLVPLNPPAAWFNYHEGTAATPFTITEEGQVFGNLALWGECHIGIDHACIMPKPSPSKYAHYQLGCTVTAEGEKLATGVLTMDTGHAPLGMGLTPKQVVAHYDNTGLAVADVVVRDGAFGPWVCGALRPDVPAVKVRALRAARMSGDWRRYPGGTDLSAILMVNVGGYEVPRTQASLVASASGADVLEMVAAGIVDEGSAIEQLADDVLHDEIDRIAATV